MEERAPYRTLPCRESEIVATIVEGLRWRGYEAFRCGQHRQDRAGSDAGIPDILCTHRSWKLGEFLGIEVKTKHGRLSPIQRRLHDLGRIIVATSWESAWAAVKAFEKGDRHA